MKKKNEFFTTRASDFNETLDRYDWMPFDSLLLDYMPAWHRLLKQQPESLIRFEEIPNTFSTEYQRAAWNGFLFGEIKAFNLLTNNEGRPLFPLSPEIGPFDYIEGDFPAQLEGELLFEDIPGQISEIGDFNYYPRWGVTPPHWTFQLHQHFRNEASAFFPQENTRVLSVGYKRIGAFTTPKKILFYFSKGASSGVTISALCEGHFYRGTNKNLLTLANSFLDSNFKGMVPDRHLLREEISFYAASLMGELHSIATIPDEHKLKQQEALGQISRLMFNLLFHLNDIKNLDTKKSYSLPRSKPVSTTKVSLDEATEVGSEPIAAVDSPGLADSSNKIVTRYIFRKREMGGWEIQFANEKIEMQKSRGCIFINKILECREGYTSFELEDKFDPPKLSTKQLPEDFQEEDTPITTAKKSKAEKTAQKKQLKDYNKGIKELLEEQEEINKLLGSPEINPETAVVKQERLAKIKKILNLAKSEAANIALEREEEDPTVIKKRQRVDAAIKHALKVITDKNGKIGKHLMSNIYKHKVPGAEGFEHKWQYRRAADIIWETK
jgi:soluble cytochrome b562